MTTFGSTSGTSVEMRMYTRDLYGRLEEETGLSTGFEPIGFIEPAAGSDRITYGGEFGYELNIPAGVSIRLM